MAFVSIGQKYGFVSAGDVFRKKIADAEAKAQANSEKKMKLFVKRIAKKTGLSEKELLALKP